MAAGLVVGDQLAYAYEAIDLSGFRDGAQHWQREHGRDRTDRRFRAEQVVEIADNMLEYQLPDGGWPKNLDPLVATPKAEIEKALGRRFRRSTLDNRNTYTQVEYLAKVYDVSRLDRFRAAAERGIDYILREQRPSGGWRGADVDAITYNDDVMLGVMRLLRNVAEGSHHFAWVDEPRRQEAAAALERAIQATLRCQIVVDGKKTAWGQQHDHETYAPVKARTYELPAICPIESTGIVQFLMSIPDPSPEIVAAIEAAVAWIEAAQIEGIRVDRVEVAPIRFKYHTVRHDVVAVEDPNAPPLWARYYEIETGRPFFCNRDGVKVDRLAEVDHERRTGYGWYSAAPRRLLEIDYPAWKRQLATDDVSTNDDADWRRLARNSLIVFTSDRTGNNEIYAIRPDGTDLQQLTDHPAEDGFPAWAPDQRSIAFISDRDGQPQVYSMSADGKSVKRLASAAVHLAPPTWSPDGKQLALTQRKSHVAKIALLDLASGKVRTLVKGDSPRWSPDGKRLLLIQGNLAALVTANVQTGKTSPIYPTDHAVHGAFCLSPIWSPHGDRIAYGRMEAEQGKKNTSVNLMVASMDEQQASSPTQIGQSLAPWSFSPDGQFLVAGTASQNEPAQLVIVDVHGTVRQRLAVDGKCFAASWSP